MSRRSVGIVGLGYWGPNLVRNFAAIQDWEVRWVCDLKEENLAKIRAQYPWVKTTSSLADLLNDPTLDLVAIATPTNTHAALAEQVLNSGKHVLVEKPLASTVVEGEKLVALAGTQGKHLFVDHTFVYAGAVRKMRQLKDSGELGDVYYFDSTRINLGLIQQDINVLWDLAIHDLSILGQIADLSTIKTIYAHGSAHHGKQIEIAHLHLGFANGMDAHIHASWLSPVKIRQTLVGGSKKMVVFDDIHPSEKLRIYDVGVSRKQMGEEKPGDPFFPMYRSGDIVIPKIDATETLKTEALHLLDCVNGMAQPLVSGKDGLAILRILDASDRSLASGTTITL